MLAFAADLSRIPKANSVAHLDRRYTRPQLAHNADSFVAQDFSGVKIMQVGAAEAGMGCLDEHFVISERFCHMVGGNLAIDAPEDIEGDAVVG